MTPRDFTIELLPNPSTGAWSALGAEATFAGGMGGRGGGRLPLFMLAAIGVDMPQGAAGARPAPQLPNCTEVYSYTK